MSKYVAARPHATSFVLITSTITCVMNVSSHIIILILCLFVHVSMYKRDIRESLGTNMFSLSCRGVTIIRILIIMFLNFRNYTSIPWVKIDNFPIHYYVILLTFALTLETKMYCARKHFVSSSAMLMLYTIGSMGSLIHRMNFFKLYLYFLNMYSYFIFCYRIIIIILLSKNIYLINSNSCCPLLVTLDPHHSLKYNNIEFNLLTSKSYLVIIISSPICILTHTKYAMFVHVVKEYISFYNRVMAFREPTNYVSVNLIMLCIPYGRLICLSTCQHNYLFVTYNIIHLYLHVCDNITLYKSWLFKLKSEDVSTKYQYSYTKSNFEPSSTKL